MKRIQKSLSNRDGLLRPSGYSCNNKPMMKGEFSICDNDELLFNISCLLKTCVLALEGDATFSSSAHSNADPKANVIVSLEFIINLLPREQMVTLDDITRILSKIELEKDQL
ncbi:hypothetical protein [Yeosuana aromativorans]|uniref:hypothetical protein n=1 Tax=Yeosuana aromativorans TaxID=288019 RepID=UPI001664A3A4|nr:hypothetical protein [Yeosuana aromativorans]